MNPWRYRCPRGHASLRTAADGWYCQPCDEVYGSLVDWKTKKPVSGRFDR